MTQTTCCDACQASTECKFWIYGSVPVAKTGYNCWLMSEIGSKVNRSDRVLGSKVTKPPFAHNSLSIEIAASKHTWHFGDIPSQNLGGTISSWNEVGPAGGAPTLQRGLLSKAGWSLIEDNAPSPHGQDPYVGGATARFTDDVDGWVDGSPWLASPDRTPGDGFDGYFFGCGARFRDCLGDWAMLSGAVPLPPKRTWPPMHAPKRTWPPMHVRAPLRVDAFVQLRYQVLAAINLAHSSDPPRMFVQRRWVCGGRSTRLSAPKASRRSCCPSSRAESCPWTCCRWTWTGTSGGEGEAWPFVHFVVMMIVWDWLRTA